MGRRGSSLAYHTGYAALLAPRPTASRHSPRCAGISLASAVAADGGTTFWTGNNAKADGTYQSLVPFRGDPRLEGADAKQLAETALNRPLRDSEVSRYWTGLALDWVRAHPGQWAKLTWRKWLMVWNWLELGDTEDQYTYGRWSPLLRALTPVLHFGVIVPCAVLGLWCLWLQHRQASIVPVMGLAYAGSLALAFLFARYRMPLVPILLMLAACALVELVDRIATRQMKSLAPGLGLALVAGLASNSNILPRNYRQSMQAATYSNIGARLLATGRARDAIEMLRESIRLAPAHPLPRYQLSTASAAVGDLDTALREGLLAFSRHPSSAAMASNVADVFAKLGAMPEANQFYVQALRLDPRDNVTRNNHAILLARAGHLAEAIEQFDRALRDGPERAESHYNLANALASAGRHQEARDHYARATALAPEKCADSSRLAGRAARSGRAVTEGQEEKHYPLDWRLSRLLISVNSTEAPSAFGI